MSDIIKLLEKNGLVFAFLVVGLIMYVSYYISKKITKSRIPGAAIAISIGLVIAYFGGENGLASIPAFSGMAIASRFFNCINSLRGKFYGDQKNRIGWFIKFSDRYSSCIYIRGVNCFFNGLP